MSDVERPQRKQLPRGLLTAVVMAIVAIGVTAVAAINSAKEESLPPNELVSVVKSDSPSVDVVTIRTSPHQGRWSQSQNDNTMTTVPTGTQVTVRCISKDVEGPGNWYYVTVLNGPVPGISGYVWGLLIPDAPRVPACGDINLNAFPPLPGTLTLSQGPKAQAGYWYRISLRGLAPNASLSVDCFDDAESVNGGGFVVNPTPFRTFQVRTDRAGNAETDRNCYSGEGNTHWVEIGPYVSNYVEWSTANPPPTTAVPPPPKPTIASFAATVVGTGQVGVSFDVGWQSGRDPVTCHFFVDRREAFTAKCGTFSSKQFTGLTAGEHSFSATVTDRYGVASDPTPTVTRTVPGGAAPPPTNHEAPPPKPTISNFTVVAYGDAGHVGVSYDVGWQAGRDPVTCHFFMDGNEVFTAQCGTHSSKQFYGISPGQHSFHATVSDRYGVYSDPSPTFVRTVAAPLPPPPGPTASLSKGPTAPSGFRYAITLDHFPANVDIAITCHDSVDPGGFYSFSLRTDGNGHAFTQSYCYSGDHPDHWFRANGVESNHVTW